MYYTHTHTLARARTHTHTHHTHTQDPGLQLSPSRTHREWTVTKKTRHGMRVSSDIYIYKDASE
jgi:hypothetical protein